MSTILFWFGLSITAYAVAGIALLLVIMFRPHWLPGWFPKF